MREQIVSRFIDAQNKLVTQASDLPLGTLSEMVESATIDIRPTFQRRERWPLDKQSALIESFILNIPVPPIYLAEEQYGSYTAIDGQQRLRAITDFLNDRFKLSGLESFTELENLKFSDLPGEIRNTLRVRPFIRVVTLLKQSDPELKYEVFVRLNRGGQPLNPQEIRNSAFRGPLNDLIYDLAKEPFLRHQLKIRDEKSSPFREMVDAELVLRFVTLHDMSGNYRGSLLRSMDQFMLAHKNANRDTLTYIRKTFIQALSRCEVIWGEHAFRRPEGSVWRDQTLAGMYDAEMLSVSRLSEAQYKRASTHRGQVIEKTKALFGNSKFDQYVRQGTNTPSRLEYRVEKIYDLLINI
jgi:Protein of unknown function DUF262